MISVFAGDTESISRVGMVPLTSTSIEEIAGKLVERSWVVSDKKVIFVSGMTGFVCVEKLSEKRKSLGVSTGAVEAREP